MSEEEKKDTAQEEKEKEASPEEEKKENPEAEKKETDKEVKEKKEEKKNTKKSQIEELEEKVKKQDAVIADLNGQVAKLKNAYAMAYADTENTRKRLTKEKDSFMKYHMQDFAKEILPVLDNCERALAAKTDDEALHKGVEMIYNQLRTALEKEGVTEIDALNKPFDGNWHQALMSEHKDGVEPGTVIEVLQKGYKYKDRILRAAMVKVSE